MTNHPPLGLVDVFSATLPTLKYGPGVHVNYAETVLPMKDGLPKFKDFPADRRIGRAVTRACRLNHLRRWSRTNVGSVRRRSMPAAFSRSHLKSGLRSVQLASGAVAEPIGLSRWIWPISSEPSGTGPALVVVVEELGLELGHVDVRRALALARLALEAEVEGLVQGLVRPGRRRAGRPTSPAAARWRGRGSCAPRRG